MKLIVCVLVFLAAVAPVVRAQDLDGRPWNVSSGNMSVAYIRMSPIGAGTTPGHAFEAPPAHETLVQFRKQGLIAYEDYVAWGAVEREEGKFDWTQHDRVHDAMKAAGLDYVVYNWVHFPPKWLLNSTEPGKRTLIKCLEHGQETNYFSIFDPKTTEWYDRFYAELARHFGDKIDGVYACILGPYGEGNYPLLVPDWVDIGHCHEGYWCADEHAIRAFSAAMEKRYGGDIAKLNAAWGEKFASFAAVRAPVPEAGPMTETRAIELLEAARPFKAYRKDHPGVVLKVQSVTPEHAIVSADDQLFKIGKDGFVYRHPSNELYHRQSEVADMYRPSPEALKTPHERRRWLDFITWYHQAIIDFAEESIKVTLKHFPRGKVRTKPGGNAGGVNPIAWGTYCPGYAKMAGKYGIVLQPADCHGAFFGDKWVGTSYAFYGVPLSTEPASLLDTPAFTRRMFSDASCGASQLFTYEFERHTEEIRKYIHLYTGIPGETELAVLCPTTLYRLGGDLKPTIEAGRRLRDLAEFDVLDELLIEDGALTNEKYKVLLITQPGYMEDKILDRIETWVRAGGTLVLVGKAPLKTIDGVKRLVASGAKASLGEGRIVQLPELAGDGRWLEAMRPVVAGLKGVDGALDGLLTSRRGGQVMLFNSTEKPASLRLDVAGKQQEVTVSPRAIWSSGH